MTEWVCSSFGVTFIFGLGMLTLKTHFIFLSEFQLVISFFVHHPIFRCGTKKAHRILNLYCLLFIWTFQKWRFNNWIEIQWTIPLLNKLTTFLQCQSKCVKITSANRFPVCWWKNCRHTDFHCILCNVQPESCKRVGANQNQQNDSRFAFRYVSKSRYVQRMWCNQIRREEWKWKLWTIHQVQVSKAT